ncbi:MAG: hypothetical protein Q7J27_14635 [Syntrophales bacterium]|nr:hypothetical protein [Syntrophales bacterium]
MSMMLLYDTEKTEIHIQTRYGYISYEEWLKKEAERIGSQPGRTVEIRRLGNKIGLWVNRVAGG